MRTGTPLAIFVALASTGAAAVACLQVPLFANPGPEAAMVLAVVGGIGLGLVQATRGAQRDPRGFLGDLGAGLVVALVQVCTFVVATAIGARLTPTCNASAGVLPFVVLALPVLALHGGIGTWIGRMAGRPRAAVVVTLLFHVACAAALGAWWVRAPGFRVLSHTSVVVTGDLLRGASMPPATIAFRFATSLFAAGIVMLGAARWPVIRRSGLSGATTSVGPLPVLGALVAFVLGGLVHVQARDAMQPPREEMQQRYSLVKRRGNLVVHADPLALSPRDVDGVLAEGTLWMTRLQTRLGPLSHDDIDIWLHATRGDVEHWTGAAHVDFTLPWRREVHIAAALVPHPSLGHELAHVVAGERSDAPLRLPSRFFLLYNAAVTEGVAMALTPESVVDDGLTLREQAAAMRRQGQAPDLRALFSGLRFFAENPGRAYVAAGALVEQIVADAGPDAPRALERLYRGDGDLDAAVVDVDVLLATHEAALRRTPLPADAEAFAVARFSRPSVLQETCNPDLRDEIDDIRTLARTGHVDEAAARAARLEGSARDGETPADATLIALVSDARSVDDEGAVLRLIERLEQAPTSTKAEHARRSFALGNEQWRRRHWREAARLWGNVDVAALTVDEQRQVLAARVFADEVQRLGDQAPLSLASLRFFTDAHDDKGGARLVLAQRIGQDDALRDDARAESAQARALARYVLGRQSVIAGSLDDAIVQLRGAIDSHALPAVFAEQAALGLATALVRSGHVDDAQALLLSAADRATRPAMRMHLHDLAERAARAASAPPEPDVVTDTSDPAWADHLLFGIDNAGSF